MPGPLRATTLLALAGALALVSVAIAEPGGDRITALHDMILDPSARFSASATLAKLDAIATAPGAIRHGGRR